MMHYKNRRPKRYKGCCAMCACRDHVMGLRNKRAPKPSDLRARENAREQMSP